MGKIQSKKTARARRRMSIRKKLRGTADRPRVAIFRSARHIYAQIIDDDAGKTLVSASTLEQAIRGAGNASNKDGASAVGKLLAERAKDANITNVVFDRGGFLYHGRVAALAEGAREGGLVF